MKGLSASDAKEVLKAQGVVSFTLKQMGEDHPEKPIKLLGWSTPNHRERRKKERANKTAGRRQRRGR